MWVLSFWQLRLSTMLWAAYIVLASTVFPAHLQNLHPTWRFLFVDIGVTAQISCTSIEDIENQALFSWYKRREHGMPILIKSCDVKKPGGRFACKVNPNRRNAILEILHVQSSDSGQYFCAQGTSAGLHFSTATSSLIVGDSYTPSTRVMLLQPSNQDPDSWFKNQLVCVVHGVSNFVQVSWDGPGGLQQEGQTLLVKNSSGSLTFVSVLHLPMELQNTGGNITCAVRFNSSSTSVKKTAVFNAASLTEGDAKCLTHKVSLAVVAGLASLLIFLSFLWVRFGLPWLGSHTKISEPPFSGITEDGICYAQLDFQAKTQDERKRRLGVQGKKSKTLKDL
ncbi:immunoglobulin kappa light chain-like [Podarcis lilfordi]|nr:immunoglobulin kappa light chain-like [Podarcis lilfordi]